MTDVLVLPQRQTALVAKQVATLALLAPGRIRLGVGIGWNAVEYQALGIEFLDRAARMEEQIPLLRRLWTEPSVDHTGTSEVVDAAGIAPLPPGPVPIWIGCGTASPALARVGRLADGWLPLPPVQPGRGFEPAWLAVRTAAADAGSRSRCAGPRGQRLGGPGPGGAGARPRGAMARCGCRRGGVQRPPGRRPVARATPRPAAAGGRERPLTARARCEQVSLRCRMDPSNDTCSVVVSVLVRSARWMITPTSTSVVIGAGFAGLYALHKFRDDLNLSVRVFEAGDGVGGTWYWNRYPGARCDSESYYYCYSFSPELAQEWKWSGRYPEQPEIERYLNHVADRFDLRRDIQLSTRVTAATFDDAANRWEIRTDRDDTVTARFLVTAVGCLSAPIAPDIPGLDDFEGDVYFTATWPREGVDFTGKRVGLDRHGLERHPGHAADRRAGRAPHRLPAHAELQPPGAPRRRSCAEDQARIKSNYDEIFARDPQVVRRASRSHRSTAPR